jgi:UDP-glucose:(heptosyl)LPS alpha-1,3-glucosyltransferase
MIRLAIVRQRYSAHGGAERFVARALQALRDRANLEVTLLAREWQDAGGLITRKLDPWYLTRTGRDAGFARQAASCFAQYDLVQSHERIPGAAIFRAGDGVHATWLEQLARIQSPLERFSTRLSPYHRHVLVQEAALFRHRALRVVICNARMVADDIKRRFEVDEHKLTVIYNGVDAEAFHPRLTAHRRVFRASNAIAQDAPLLGFVGSGFVRKGLATALAAIAAHPRVCLVIAGADKRCARYERMAATLGIAHRVRFLGSLADVRPLYGAIDALILPSLYDPFSNACVEAMASGLPVFTSPMCGAAEWIRVGENGWVIDALDVHGYRAALADWLARRDHWPMLGAQARAAAEPHTLQRMADELTALYARLTERQ